MTKREFLAYGSQNGLKILHFDGNREVESIHDIMNISHEEIVIFDGENEYAFPTSEAIPIVRPLSDLNKPCLTGNKTPLIELANLYCAFYNTPPNRKKEEISSFIRAKELTIIESGIIHKQPFFIIEKLIEWKFDIIHLIDNKEGIDVNTLEVNPYVSHPLF